MKCKIIHIMNEAPSYAEFANKSRPKINWNLPNKSWIGIWGDEWGDEIGSELVKVDPEITYEVWQPDLRANKVYSHNFEGGWTHTLFPAMEKSYYYGIKKKKYIISEELLELLEENLTSDTILHLPFPQTPLIQSVIRKFKHNKIVCTCFGDLPLPLKNIWKINKNFPSKINLIRNHFIIKRLLKDINSFTIINHNHIELFRKLFSGPYSIVPIGINTDFWRKKDKKSCRIELNLPLEKTILLSSSRLNSLKQVDILISILDKLSSRYEFLYVVSGHGTRSYEDYLMKKARNLADRQQILFTGYISKEELHTYYNAADVFILTSLSEGSPVAVQKAFSCGVPVLSTNVGYTAELMQTYKAGVLMPKTDYTKWKECLRRILEKDFPTPFDISLAINYFDWNNVSRKFLDVFKAL